MDPNTKSNVEQLKLSSKLEFLVKVNLDLPYDPAILLLDILPKRNGKLHLQDKTCIGKFIATLFTIAPNWSRPNAHK